MRNILEAFRLRLVISMIKRDVKHTLQSKKGSCENPFSTHFHKLTLYKSQKDQTRYRHTVHNCDSFLLDSSLTLQKNFSSNYFLGEPQNFLLVLLNNFKQFSHFQIHRRTLMAFILNFTHRTFFNL